MTVYVQGENGVICGIWDDAVLPDGIAHRLKTGDLTRVTEDGQPWTADADEVEPDAPLDAPELPKRTASRAEWTEFAVSQGMDRGEAATMTKAELIARFTQQD